MRSEPGGDLKFGMDPGYMQDVLEEYKLENAKGLPTPPCLRDLLDKSLDEASDTGGCCTLPSGFGEVVLVECYSG